ncbi:MAG: TonB-dependent receptor [Nevskiales bacterium]|nr:TonB-dependent receptor [Nevskiales bacterium]
MLRIRAIERAAIGVAVLAGSGAAVAVSPTELGTVTVTATRVDESSFEVPASIAVVPGSEFNVDTLGVNLSEGLSAVPGLVARNRQNYAQDLQISIRAFGARSAFGIRGVRLYADGIPATQPDGQGQVSHFNLATADRVEVVRGPFSALYGNSSGGVLEIFTADGADPEKLSFAAAAGSFNTWRANLGVSGAMAVAGHQLDYNLGYMRFETDGFRDHSEAQRDSVNGKVNLKVGSGGKLTLMLNSLSSPDTQDPLGLTREQVDQDPSQADAVAEQFDTRKSIDQTQVGAVYEHQWGDAHKLRVLGYGGNRQIEQFLAIPTGPQNSSTHSGGVIDLNNDFWGLDARWSWRSRLARRPFTLVLGTSYDDLSQHRRGYENFVGDQLGVRGDKRRDEINDVYDFDQYLQANWSFAEQWSLLAGVRHSRVKFESSDRYVTDENPNDSGSATYSETTPVAGLLYRHSPVLHLYAAYGSGFETPTLVELAYRPDGGSGLNLDLDAARTNNAEIGAKFMVLPYVRAELAVFQAQTRDELVVATNSGGRATYQNAGRTRRQGAEASLNANLGSRLHAVLAYSWIKAEVDEDYLACTGRPCADAVTLIREGNRLPGVPESSLYGALRWGNDTGWQATLDATHVSAVPVNDINSESAPSYHLVGVSGAYVVDVARTRIRGFVSVDNLLDDDYVGSVIVNDGNGRYYEPGPGRTVLVGFRLDLNH